ncbi:phage tail terminator protein [Thaumasiovibrio subtropicus]|uniref:phage tail terminator protein n=1 Tax=Thaumasiovibrio subtropicus TaxID=1891207 RepID=UPI000B35011E|nr:hypothetical protein [Thaumasiovibrio subtropicus]
MPNIIDRTIGHLKTSAQWRDVKPLGGLSEFDIKRSGLRTPTLFVFVVSENPKPDVRGSGPYLQSITVTLGVVIVDSNRNGRELNFTSLRQALRQQLFGWQPTKEHEPYWLGPGRLLSIEKGQASWIDHFVTEYTADQNHV